MKKILFSFLLLLPLFLIGQAHNIIPAGDSDTASLQIQAGQFTSQGISNTIQYDGVRYRLTANDSRQRQVIQTGSQAYVASNTSTVSGTEDDIGLLTVLVPDNSDLTYQLPPNPTDGDRYYFVMAPGNSYSAVLSGGSIPINTSSTLPIPDPMKVFTIQYHVYAGIWVAW